MPIDLAAIFIGVLAIVVSVVAGVYAAGAISSEYVAKITARLISLEHKVDILLDQQARALDTENTIPDPPAPTLLELSQTSNWPAPTSEE